MLQLQCWDLPGKIIQLIISKCANSLDKKIHYSRLRKDNMIKFWRWSWLTYFLINISKVVLKMQSLRRSVLVVELISFLQRMIFSLPEERTYATGKHARLQLTKMQRCSEVEEKLKKGIQEKSNNMRSMLYTPTTKNVSNMIKRIALLFSTKFSHLVVIGIYRFTCTSLKESYPLTCQIHVKPLSA